MQLNKPSQKLIDKLKASGGKAFHEMTIEEYRQAIEDCLPMAGKPEQVSEVIERNVDGPNGVIPLKIYIPEKLESDGAIVYFCGSGFLHGYQKQQDVVCRALANRAACKIIDIPYRSAPEYKFPKGLNDAYAGTKWIYDHSKELDIDQNKIGVCGYSSGGNFAAVVAIRARNAGIKLACQILIAANLDSTYSASSYDEIGEKYLSPRAIFEYINYHYLPENIDLKNPEISPVFEKNLKGLPGALIITAECDPLYESGEAYAKRLTDAGIEVKYSKYSGQLHNFIFFRGELQEELNPLDEIGRYIQNKFEK